MAKRPEGQCQSCGGPMAMVTKNRKLCQFCQVERDRQFRPGWSCKCEICNRQIWPIRISHKNCYMHSNYMPIRPDEYPACSSCGQHKRTAPASGKGTCLDCVTKSPENQARYQKANAFVVQERRRKYLPHLYPSKPEVTP